VPASKYDIALAHLLTMTAGLSWNESSEQTFESLTTSPDWPGWILSRPLANPPGTSFNYSTGLTHVAALILTRESGVPLFDYAMTHLFDPIGIEPQRWDRDPAGTYFGGAEVFMPPRDLARFGQLYLQRGALDGSSVVDPAWVDGTTQDLVGGYGAWWWIRSFGGHHTFHAWGYGGQFIYVVPDLDLVIVFTSTWTVDPAVSGDQADQIMRMLDDVLEPAIF
jgi:CubicO group peptidase (beta-lactamase class C family)